MIIKCKMCGGDILFQPGDTYGTCEFCGSVCTIPKVEDEQQANRYNRANHFRRQCDFDKAIGAYEKILESNEGDAEAHFGIALSRYGIEYVEDPATDKRVPTCHRVQVKSILADEDYLAALEYAPDNYSR
ncbi:MAG: tetratricopeptide repeat protein, partial [Clostridia bacterium]|nr:tetratricopeptide repeat protein [Clostridia bacterium]